MAPPSHNFFVGGIETKIDQNRIGVIIALVFLIRTGIPTVSSSDSIGLISSNLSGSDDATNITDVPYVWQEINGFCHWSAYSMILQSAGVPLDLYDVFAATGIGFTASYIRFATNMILWPGPFFPQMLSTFAIEDIYGVNISMFLDRTASEDAGIFGNNLESLGIDFTEVVGFESAFAELKNTIESGYPYEIWSDPYYLPPLDYDILRDLGIHYDDTKSGHAIVATGYNETAGIVHILDPGVGVIEDVEYPEDGRYSYDLNLTQLDATWKPLYYAGFSVLPGDGLPEDFSTRLGNHILQRLRGDRSYLASMEDSYFWVLGSDAFRGLAYDLTSTGLQSYLGEFGSLLPNEKAIVLKSIGLMTEGFLTIQYLSFRSALEAVPSMLPELELDTFVAAGLEALTHFESICDNASLSSLYYDGGATITTDTLYSIAYDCHYTYNGDIENAVADNEQDLETIRNHLMAIADAWDAAADAFDMAVNGDVTTLVISIVGIVAFVSLVSVFAYRRSKA